MDKILTAVTSGSLWKMIRYGSYHGLDNLRYLPVSSWGKCINMKSLILSLLRLVCQSN